MKSFVVDIDGYMDEEEERQLEEEIRQFYANVLKNKKADDYRFDYDFNEAIESRYYEPKSTHIMFISFEYRFNSIYQYYQYTRRYIAAYETEANKYYHNAPDSQEEDALSDYAPDGMLIHLNCESIILMTYSVFETFLREFIETTGDRTGVLKYPKDDLTPLKYLEYLNNEKGIFVPRKLYRDYNEIRLVRNYYAHGLDSVQSILKRSLNRDPHGILFGNRLIVNHQYVEHVFEVIGNMVKAIEAAFEMHYPNDF